MKKLIVWACLSMLPFTYAAAEGYQVNAQSTKQAGMGHVGVAMKLGAESMHFNPAGLAFMENNIHLSAGVSGIFSKGKFTDDTGYMQRSDNTPSTPLYVYAGFKIYDFLAAGVSVTTPYGSAMDWGKDWKAASLVQDISLKAFNIQPTVSWKITDRLSIGAGLMMEFGNIELSRALIGPGAMNEMANGLLPQLAPVLQQHPEWNQLVGTMVNDIRKYKDASAASVNLRGDAGVRLGFNVGAMFDVNEKITVGVSYRSKVKARVKEGDITLSYANETDLKENLLPQVNNLLQTIRTQYPGISLPIQGVAVPPLDQGTFSAELPLPDNWNVGITYMPTERWTVSGEVQFVGWGAYKTLAIEFSPSSLSQFNLVADKLYHNSRIYRVGAQFAATNRLDVRLGAYYDESPVKDDYLNPETPSMDKFGITAGLSFRPIDPLSIDFAFSYVTGFGRDGSYPDRNMLTGTVKPMGGHYDIYALMPAIGVSYAF